MVRVMDRLLRHALRTSHRVSVETRPAEREGAEGLNARAPPRNGERRAEAVEAVAGVAHRAVQLVVAMPRAGGCGAGTSQGHRLPRGRIVDSRIGRIGRRDRASVASDEKNRCHSHYKSLGPAPRGAPRGLVPGKDAIAPPPPRDRDARVSLALRSRLSERSQSPSRVERASSIELRALPAHDRIAE
jgi:hypothetical protein